MYLVTRGITFCLHALSCLDILLCFMSEDAGSVGSCIPLSRRNHLYTFVFVLRSIIIFLFSPSIFVLFLQCDTSCLSILLFYSCLSILWLPSVHLSTIAEEELEDLLSDSSEDGLNPLVHTPVVRDTILSWRRVYNFPSPENFRRFVESPSSPTQSEGKASPKYACC